jgi:hypothetical protein
MATTKKVNEKLAYQGLHDNIVTELLVFEFVDEILYLSNNSGVVDLVGEHESLFLQTSRKRHPKQELTDDRLVDYYAYRLPRSLVYPYQL